MAYNQNEDPEKLLFADFLSYYETKANEDPEMVRVNLSIVGLRSDMQVIPKPGESDDCLNPRKSAEEMPRYKLANVEKNF